MHRLAHNKMSNKEFIKKVEQIHPSYSLLEEYKGQRYIECKCKKHNVTFKLDKVNNVLSSKNIRCKDCKRDSRLANDLLRIKQAEFENRVLALFPSHKVLGKYVNVKTPVKTFCSKHNIEFDLLPNNALYNKYSQCPGCRKGPPKSSKISESWIKWVCKSKRWKFANVMCSENGLEFHIKGVGNVDGYHKPTNTVLEFHGDYWHGNPRRFPSNKVMFSGFTAKQLYTRTKKKEAKIIALGFNLITMWEHDYRLFSVNS